MDRTRKRAPEKGLTMNSDAGRKDAIGWIGVGRMGYAMAERLAKAGSDVTVWNRTPAKAEPLAASGAKVAQRVTDLAACDIVFVMVSAWKDVEAVLTGPSGLLSGASPAKPKLIVECSSISIEGSMQLRNTLREQGIALLAAPVSGTAKVINAGRLSFVCSGPRSAYDRALPYMRMIGPTASYVGEGELARIVKICHNVFLGVVTQSLAEITILAQKAGVPRHAFLAFMNDSVLGSTFSRYKTPAFVNLDFKVTFTPHLLRKDLDLGLDAGRHYEVPMPLASMTRDLLQTLIGRGMADGDFAQLLRLEAEASGIQLQPEDVPVGDGLG
jgi:3-hydroxyisobutyrate dehydrogenase-like beta-hydroxyacid dehydrogenase